MCQEKKERSAEFLSKQMNKFVKLNPDWKENIIDQRLLDSLAKEKLLMEYCVDDVSRLDANIFALDELTPNCLTNKKEKLLMVSVIDEKIKVLDANYNRKHLRRSIPGNSVNAIPSTVQSDVVGPINSSVPALKLFINMTETHKIVEWIKNVIEEFDPSKYGKKQQLPVDIPNEIISYGNEQMLVRGYWIKKRNLLLKVGRKHKMCLVTGQDGRGKKTFMVYLTLCILMKAKHARYHNFILDKDLPEGFDSYGEKFNRSVNGDRRTSFECVDEQFSRVINPIVYLVCDDEAHIKFAYEEYLIRGGDYKSHYYFYDCKKECHASTKANFLTMAFLSDGAIFGRFEKNGLKIGERYVHFHMLSPSVQEIKAMSHGIKDIDERLEVVGCHSRLIRGMKHESFIYDDDMVITIRNAAIEAVGIDNKYVNWITTCRIMDCFNGMQKSYNSEELYSMFIDIVSCNENDRDDYSKVAFVPASRLMFVVGRLKECFNQLNTAEALSNIFGFWWKVFKHEYDTHQYLRNLPVNAKQLCWNKNTRKWEELLLGPPQSRAKTNTQRNVRYISNINDM